MLELNVLLMQLKQVLSDYTEELHAARAEGLRKVGSCMTIYTWSHHKEFHAGSDRGEEVVLFCCRAFLFCRSQPDCVQCTSKYSYNLLTFQP